MKENETVALIVLGFIAALAIVVLPDGGGKEVALALGGAIGGYLAKGLSTPTTTA